MVIITSPMRLWFWHFSQEVRSMVLPLEPWQVWILLWAGWLPLRPACCEKAPTRSYGETTWRDKDAQSVPSCIGPLYQLWPQLTATALENKPALPNWVLLEFWPRDLWAIRKVTVVLSHWVLGWFVMQHNMLAFQTVNSE